MKIEIRRGPDDSFRASVKTVFGVRRYFRPQKEIQNGISVVKPHYWRSLGTGRLVWAWMDKRLDASLIAHVYREGIES